MKPFVIINIFLAMSVMHNYVQAQNQEIYKGIYQMDKTLEYDSSGNSYYIKHPVDNWEGEFVLETFDTMVIISKQMTFVEGNDSTIIYLQDFNQTTTFEPNLEDSNEYLGYLSFDAVAEYENDCTFIFKYRNQEVVILVAWKKDEMSSGEYNSIKQYYCIKMSD